MDCLKEKIVPWRITRLELLADMNGYHQPPTHEKYVSKFTPLFFALKWQDKNNLSYLRKKSLSNTCCYHLYWSSVKSTEWQNFSVIHII